MTLTEILNSKEFDSLLTATKEQKDLHNKLFNSDRKFNKQTLKESCTILGYK